MEVYLDDSAWDDTSFLASLAALHGMRLACASLPIAEQAHLLHPKPLCQTFAYGKGVWWRCRWYEGR